MFQCRACVMVAVALLGGIRLVDEQAVAVKDIPRAVMDVVKKRFPQGEITSASKEDDDDEQVYEVELKNAGKTVTVSVEEEGELVEIETEVVAGDLPKAVRESLGKAYPGSRIEHAEEVIRFEDDDDVDGEAKETVYELAIRTANGEMLEVTIATNGEIAPGETSEDLGDFTSDFSVEKPDLVSIGRNPYFILEPGYRIVLENSREQVIITVLDETKVVDGVETRVVEERESRNGVVEEVSRNFYAISKRTNNVYYFGEEVDEYQEGKVVSHSGAWLAGVDGAKFGLMMPGLPLLGARYFQEFAPEHAMDRAEIVGLSVTMETPAGRFDRCLKIEESSPLEPGHVETKHYAPGIGQIQDESLKLVRYGRVELGRD